MEPSTTDSGTMEPSKMEPVQPVDFDANPPMPVNEYARTVRAVNAGYDLLFTLTHAFLRGLQQPALQLLVVGAGGGAEIERLLPNHPDWHLTGVDPSAEMLALARGAAERQGVSDRVHLVRGSVDNLPLEACFDAATCLFVLHFLPDAAKLALLQGIFQRLRPGAPLLVATGARIEADAHLRQDLIATWQQHGELMGLPAPRMASIIANLLPQQAHATTEADYVALLHRAGFEHVASTLRVMGGGIAAWVARGDASPLERTH